MKSLNKVQLIGRLGQDAELSYTPNGKPVSKFSVATDTQFKDGNGELQKKTNWTNCVQWSAEKLAPYLKKGTMVYVEGRLETRSFDGKEGHKVWVTEVIVNDLILLGGNSNASAVSNAEQSDESLPF